MPRLKTTNRCRFCRCYYHPWDHNQVTCSPSCATKYYFKTHPNEGKKRMQHARKASVGVLNRSRTSAVKSLILGGMSAIQLYDLAYKRGYQAGWVRRDKYYKEGIRISGRHEG